MRALVLGSMPEGATPLTHIASGPWCFSGREALFPDWTTRFPMPQDPYPDAAAMAREAGAANGEVSRLIRLFGDAFDAQSGRARSSAFWQMALGPFLLPAVHMLAERQRRVRGLLACHGSEPLLLELLPEDCAFSFRSTLDFIVRGVQDVRFNHYVFSRLLEAVFSSSEVPWQVSYLPAGPLRESPDDTGRRTLRGAAVDAARRALRHLPFPRYKGFSPPQALLLSLAVLGNKKGREDRRLDFSLYGDRPLSWMLSDGKLVALIRACLPADLLAGLSAPVPERGRGVSGPLRGMTPAYMQDDSYRLRLAAMLEAGFRLFCLQHGANYGNLRSVGILPFEYSQHAFFTWGWRTHEGLPANALPMPHPALAGICEKHTERAPELILVGTEMSCFLYRLKSRPQAKALLEYRERKLRFFRSAHLPDPAPKLLYRPYFPVAGGLDDAGHVLRHLPHIALCEGDLTARMLGCRLLVLDHYGTTLHMALAADVPTLAFWKREEWGMEAQSDTALDLLAACGILHASAEDAARQARTIWKDPAAWWKSPPVRNARATWLRRYAMVGDDPEQAWSSWKLTWKWFAALGKC